MTKIEHKYERVEISPDAGFCHVWKITITHNDKTYHAEISNVAYNVAYRHGDDYWNGFIYLDEYDEEGYEKLYINFNCQNVYNSLSCILIGIKEIVNEDFSNVDSSDFYHSNINDVISNKSKILNKISHKSLHDKIIYNIRKELWGLSKEELLKCL
jgi:hypothetical protein